MLTWEESDDDFINCNQIYTVLLYMIMTPEQEELMTEDPNQFISDEDNEFTSKELKSWCSDFILEIIDQHAKIPLILSAIEQLLIGHSKQSDSHEGEHIDSGSFIYHNESNEFSLKTKEVGLY
jgi:transposase InsO family protein